MNIFFLITLLLLLGFFCLYTVASSHRSHFVWLPILLMAATLASAALLYGPISEHQEIKNTAQSQIATIYQVCNTNKATEAVKLISFQKSAQAKNKAFVDYVVKQCR